MTMEMDRMLQLKGDCGVVIEVRANKLTVLLADGRVAADITGDSASAVGALLRRKRKCAACETPGVAATPPSAAAAAGKK